jgi:hypothetical protein
LIRIPKLALEISRHIAASVTFFAQTRQYVNDILIYGRSKVEIDKLIERLKNDDIALHKEGTAEDYLGVDIQREGVNIWLKQEGLTKRIIQALGLDLNV